MIDSTRDTTLSATVLSRKPLWYAAGADATQDRPAYVRAGSSLAWLGGRIAVIQDDANFIALVDPTSGHADALALPAGRNGLRQFDDLRGNKPHKLDLEACFSVSLAGGETVLALGSGSTRQRETIAIIPAGGPARLTNASGFYAALRAKKAFSGSELNLEGSVFIDGWVRLFNRGNGAARDDLVPCNATCDIAWDEFAACLRDPHAVPRLQRIVQYDLGTLQDAPLTFTDATVTAFGLLYTAAAENSHGATRDGAVAGSAIGILTPEGGRWIELRNADGSLSTDKIEGICAAVEGNGRLYGIVDADDPTRPSELCEIVVEGLFGNAIIT